MTATLASRKIETLTVRDCALTMVPMTAPELADWEWATETFKTPRNAGFAQLRGWSVYLADGSHLGLIISNGFDMMAEWWNPDTRDYESVGELPRAKTLIAANYLVDAMNRRNRALMLHSQRLNLEWDIRGEWERAERERTGSWWVKAGDMPAELLRPILDAAWTEHCERAQAERLARALVSV